MKNRILIIAVILTLGCVVLVVLSSQKIDKCTKDINAERYKRMVAEERLENTRMKINSLRTEMTNLMDQIENIKAQLEEEKSTNADLKSEIEKVTKLKNVLEQQLKNALVAP